MRWMFDMKWIKAAVTVVVSFVGVTAAFCSPVPGWDALTSDAVKPHSGNERARLESSGRFLMDADLSSLEKGGRASWDFILNMDLRRQVGISFDFYCSDVLQFTGFNIYLRCGKGWRIASFSPAESGKWHRLTVMKSEFNKVEGVADGWGKINTMRISGWAGGKSKVKFGIANLSFVDFDGPVVGVVRGESCAADPKYKSEQDAIARFASATASALEHVGVNVFEISDVELDRETLQGMKLLVFPYNPQLPKGKEGVVNDFAAGGGKIFACHAQSTHVRKALGLDPEKYRKRNWRSSSETPSKEKGGFYLPHVWRYGAEDSARQAYDLLSQVDPSWKVFLDKAKAKAEAEMRKETEWVASLPSKKGEWRAFWCHSERGLGKNHNWDSSIKLLKENGFNTIIPNLAWGGVAYYKSSVLPVHSSVWEVGDAFDECLAACRKYGVQCHVWKVCWRLGQGVDKEYAKRLVAEGRVQVGFNGSKKDMWMCPSHPTNLKLEQDAFIELAKKGPDGIHFDYIRYPDMNCCFCDGCRERFEKMIGRKVGNWPNDVRSDAALASEWLEFRRSNITALVKGVSEHVRREYPSVQISAAVFHNPQTDPDKIGQDWVHWSKEGYLDFLCPMDYNDGSGLPFRGLVEAQARALKGGKAKLRPGLGLSCWKDIQHDAATLSRQIMIVREIGLDGFSVFNFDARAEKVLPKIHTGPTR